MSISNLGNHMEFKLWLENSLKDLLEPVPQSPEHHEEGDVYTHTRMVRKALDPAKSLLSKESNKGPFVNINFNLDEKEEKILRMASLLHDIGKASATTIDGNHWSKGGSGKIQAIGHDKSDHYLPMIDKISPVARKMLDNLSKDELDDLYFCIDHHMSLRDKFSKRVSGLILDNSGNYKNERRVKLLLHLITMDWIGRISGDKGGTSGGMKAIEGFKNSAEEVKQKNKRVKTSIDDPIDFIKSMRDKHPSIIYIAFKNKFKRDMTQEEKDLL
jgi:hypothetical protein